MTVFGFIASMMFAAVFKNFDPHFSNCDIHEIGTVGAITAFSVFWVTTLMHSVTRKKKTSKALLEIQTKLSGLEERNRELLESASIDWLTGLSNRRAFERRLQEEWSRCFRNKKPLSVFFCDIDFFKQYNDRFGHHAGDECLRRVSKIFQMTVQRPTDFSARYGGEEFVCVLSETDLPGALIVAENLRQAVENSEFSEKPRAVPKTTVSIGVASCFPSEKLTPSQLLLDADSALYQAKAQGRNRVCYTSVPEA